MSHAEAVAALLDAYVAGQVADATVPLRLEIRELDSELAEAYRVSGEREARVVELEAERARLAARIAELETPVDAAVLPYWGAPVWRDEFDGDLSKWNVRSRADLGLTIDAAIPDPAMVSIDKGILHIRAEWLPTPQTRTKSATGVTILTHRTGYLDTRVLKPGNVEFAIPYGRWEARIKTPTGPNTLGALAAFWLRSIRTGETDIIEAWGYSGAMQRDFVRLVQDAAANTVHTNTSGSGTKVINYLGVRNPWEDFHVYAWEHTPTHAAMFVDGREVFRVTPEADGGTGLWNPKYYGAPQHMRLNLHVGPNPSYWGLPDPNRREMTGPLDMQVDYVRVYAVPQ